MDPIPVRCWSVMRNVSQESMGSMGRREERRGKGSAQWRHALSRKSTMPLKAPIVTMKVFATRETA